VLKKEFDLNTFLYERTSRSSFAELNEFKLKVEDMLVRLNEIQKKVILGNYSEFAKIFHSLQQTHQKLMSYQKESEKVEGHLKEIDSKFLSMF
jgi:hypothetical protein